MKTTDTNSDENCNYCVNGKNWLDDIRTIVEYYHDTTDEYGRSSLISKYSKCYPYRNYELDYVRYIFSYLKTININQALVLYDSLEDSMKCSIVKIIQIDKIHHLSEIINIHNVLFHNVPYRYS
jgi:hypothetical protein